MGIVHTRPWRSKAEWQGRPKGGASKKPTKPKKRRRPANGEHEVRGPIDGRIQLTTRPPTKLPFRLTLERLDRDDLAILDRRDKAPSARVRLTAHSGAGFAFFRAWCEEAGIAKDRILGRRRLSALVSILILDARVLKIDCVRWAIESHAREVTGKEASGPSVHKPDSRQRVSQFDQRDRSWRGHR